VAGHSSEWRSKTCFR